MPELQYDAQNQLEERVGSRFFYIEMHEKTGDFMPHFHYHSSYELFYIKRGTAKFMIGNKNYIVHEGSLLIIPPYIPHKSFYSKNQENHRIELQIKKTSLTKNISGILDILSKDICYTLSLKYQHNVLKLFTSIRDEFRSKRQFSEDLCLAYIHELLIFIYRNAVKCNVVTTANEVLTEKLMAYIAENYHRDITIAELSNEYHVCDSTIYKSFKKHTGLKVTDYINFTRIMNAERLMRETDLSLTEISYRCGFNNYNYFSSVFKRYKNTTPGKFIHHYKSLCSPSDSH